MGRVEPAKHVADEIAALVARTRMDDETIPAQLRDAANAVREGLT